MEAGQGLFTHKHMKEGQDICNVRCLLYDSEASLMHFLAQRAPQIHVPALHPSFAADSDLI